MAVGAWVNRTSDHRARLILTASRSGTKVSWVLKLEASASIYATNNYSISGAVSRSGSYTAANSGAFIITIASGSFTSSNSGKINASAALYWGATATVSVSFGASGSRPSPPTNLRMTGRDTSNPNKFTLAWDGVSGATHYVIRAQQNGGAWYDMTTSNTTSKLVEYGSNNIQRTFNVRAVNSIGRSDASAYYGPVYGRPTKPNKPTLTKVGSRIDVVLFSAGTYKTGWEIQKENPNETFTKAGTNQTWSDTETTTPLTRYRARVYAGDGVFRGYSEWSEWSDTVMGSYYDPPRISYMNVIRVDSNDNPSEIGTYLRVISSGTVTKVPGTSGETNTLQRTIQYREQGTTAWSSQKIDINPSAPNNWARREVKTGVGTFSQAKSYDVRLVVKDAYSDEVYAYAVVPVSQVALSMDSKGVGVGKIIEQGTLDVGGDAYISGETNIEGPLNVAGGIPTNIVTGRSPSNPEILVKDSNSTWDVSFDGSYPEDDWNLFITIVGVGGHQHGKVGTVTGRTNTGFTLAVRNTHTVSAAAGRVYALWLLIRK